MLLTRLAVGVEPLNAFDAAHRSPRSAPASGWAEFGSPVRPATRRPIKRNKELSKRSLYFPRLPKRKLRCSFTPKRAAPTSGTRIFDKPSPKGRCRSGMRSRFIGAVCFVRGCKGGALRATAYRDDQRLSRGQVDVTRLNQYDHRFLHP